MRQGCRDEFLLGLRMEAAKALCDEGCFRVPELSKKAGYANEYSFRRAFLRYEKIRIQDYIAISSARKEGRK